MIGPAVKVSTCPRPKVESGMQASNVNKSADTKFILFPTIFCTYSATTALNAIEVDRQAISTAVAITAAPCVPNMLNVIPLNSSHAFA